MVLAPGPPASWPVESYELFRRDRHDAMTTLDLPPQIAGATSTVAPTVPTQQPGMPEVPDVPPPSTRP